MVKLASQRPLRVHSNCAAYLSSFKGAIAEGKTIKMELVEWRIDLDALFANYSNFLEWEGETEVGGVVFGANGTIHHVFFLRTVDEEKLDAIRTALSSDIDLVGRLTIDDVRVDGFKLLKGFEIFATKEILKGRRKEELLQLNPSLAQQVMKLPKLAVSTVSFDTCVRAGAEMKELQSSMARFDSLIDQLAFITSDKALFLHRGSGQKEMLSKAYPKDFQLPLETIQQTSLWRLDAFHSLEPPENENEVIVPIIRVAKGCTMVTSLRFNVVCAASLSAGVSSEEFRKRLLTSLRRRLRASNAVLQKFILEKKPLCVLTSLLFAPPGWSRHLHLQYPEGLTPTEALEWRRSNHILFNLPKSFPVLRQGQSLLAESDPFLLRDLHNSLSPYKPIGEMAVVRSGYDYYHYLQKGFDDCGWGCAYRSLQTIASFFLINGLAEGTVPTHRQIQQCLVDIGDKPSKFVGSTRWIGSTELSFVLETLLGISCKIITTNSGAEVVERVRDLLHHFRRTGTPVMIGGGQLAHTILGVDADLESGEARFLVLDPHYTGRDDVNSAIAGGGLQWKKAEFWQKQHFYNLLLPQVPANVI